MACIGCTMGKPNGGGAVCKQALSTTQITTATRHALCVHQSNPIRSRSGGLIICATALPCATMIASCNQHHLNSLQTSGMPAAGTAMHPLKHAQSKKVCHTAGMTGQTCPNID